MPDSSFKTVFAMHMQRSPRSRRVAMTGFSLIELMVSLAIGLVITVAALSAYVGSSSAGRIADAQSRMNEDAQAALSVLSQQIRLAGANPVQVRSNKAYWHNPVYKAIYRGGTSETYTTTLPTVTPTTYTLSAYAIRGCDGTFSNITGASAAANLDALTCTATANVPDSIAVSYEADKYDTAQTTGGIPTDCLGQSVPILATVTFPASTSTPTTATLRVADNRFYIANQPSRTPTVPSLYCKGNGNTTAQPLVENVEDLQITYGVVDPAETNKSTPSKGASIAGYLTSNQVNTDTNMVAVAGATNANQWGLVVAVRICVVVRSENPVAPDSTSAQYYKCDGTLDSTKTDLRLRRAYSTTVVLRNRRS